MPLAMAATRQSGSVADVACSCASLFQRSRLGSMRMPETVEDLVAGSRINLEDQGLAEAEGRAGE
jgi:hypothetical protein